MEKEQCFEFGRMGKPIGHQGALRLHHDTDDVSVYRGIKWILLELPGGLVPYAIKAFKTRPDDTVHLELEGIDSEEKAKSLQGMTCFLPLEVLPKLSGKKFYFHEIIGWSVVDSVHGAIGLMEDILEQGHQNLFKINHGGKEILVPVHDDFIDKVDRQNKELRLKTPAGLIELYVNDASEEEQDDDLHDLFDEPEENN
jgi:16S rRNA processing protein RimM